MSEETMSDFDDLAVGLARAERKPWLTRSTAILGGAVIAIAGFIGGIEAQKANTPASTAANQAQRSRYGFPGGQGFPGIGTLTSPAASATAGKIKLVDGTTLYIETADGDVITVKTGSSTKVQSASTVKVGDLKAGATVTIQGQTSSDGSTITATTVTATK
jgi:hypothetical protein